MSIFTGGKSLTVLERFVMVGGLFIAAEEFSEESRNQGEACTKQWQERT